ncbi:hypothetical protein HNQ64_004448 [Prosthecobacter dejongeii]|uniref:Uncharacterized protein n=1 Tax=Prosthecobacter dejongeii TaxID=48465 RepID=A0A7W7YQ71_9BACT|nr:hypothetical protein [Prosthecobacter dejongeii]
MKCEKFVTFQNVDFVTLITSLKVSRVLFMEARYYELPPNFDRR